MGWDEPEGRLPDPVEAEFRKWIPYIELHALFPDGRPEGAIADKLYYRLVNGSIYAAGVNAAWRDGTGQAKRRWITAIDPRWWGPVGSRGVANAFQAGDVNLTVQDRDIGNVPVHFHNLRFEYDGILDALPGLMELLEARTGKVHRDRPSLPAKVDVSQLARSPPPAPASTLKIGRAHV